MRSESTSALGQPRETKPTLGAALGRVRCFDGGVPTAVRFGSAAFFVAVFILGRGRAGGVVGAFARGRCKRVVGGEIREREAAEKAARLFLHLLLHLEECVGALLEI